MRKGFLGGMLMLMALLVPAMAQAAVWRSGQDVKVNEVVNDDLYLAGGTVEVAGTVNGDVVAAGGTVTISGAVNGDLIVAGGDVTISGTVQDDVRLLGGQLHVSGPVGDDVLAAGGALSFDSSSSIGGEIIAAGGSLRLAGKSQGVTLASSDIALASTAVVDGDLEYWGGKEAAIEGGALVSGRTTYHRAAAEESSRRASKASGLIISILSSALMAWLLFLLVPGTVRSLAAAASGRFGNNLLGGFLFLVAFPVLCVLLMVTVVGMPLGVTLLLAYPLILYVAMLLQVFAIGSWLLAYFKREVGTDLWQALLAALVGAVAVQVVGMIPIVGWLAVAVTYLAVLGALVQRVRSGRAAMKREVA